MSSPACCATDSTRLVSIARGPLFWSGNFSLRPPPDNDALRDVKLNVFGVEDGKPIMDPKKHPAFPTLRRVYAGDSLYSHALVLFGTEAEHESVLDQGGLTEHKEFMNLLGNLIGLTVLSR
jgi:hypothetical protein